MFRNVAKQEIKISAEMRNLAKLRDFVGKIGDKYRFETKATSSLKLVVDEICTNIIRHGYRDVKNGEILLRAIVKRLSLTLVIIDRGKSYDPRTSKDPDLSKYIDIGKKGGLGTFMVRKLVDDIQYSVTTRGNELRLTKFREEPEENYFRKTWHNFSIRQKSTSISAAVITIIGIFAFIYFNQKVEENAIEAMTETAFSLNAGISKALLEPIKNDNIILLFEEAKAIHEGNPDLVSQSVIYDTSWQPLAMFPIGLYYYQDLKILNAVKDRIDYSNPYMVITDDNSDSSLFAFVSPLIDSSLSIAKLGYSVIYTSDPYGIKNSQGFQLELLLTIFVMLLFGYAGSYVLVSLIVSPFQKLAVWVTQVGKGHIDEDELDIDTSDELGEIAQAFNEMSVKFRESQHSLIERQRMAKELQVAQEIQQMLLPTDFPDVFGYDITAYYQAAKEVGGDLFDFVEVDENTIGIIVADVSGKGVPGSLVMTMIRTALRMEARGNKDPGDVLSRVNTFVTEDIRKGMFVTAFYIVLDSRTRIISYASAGHNPIILYRGKTKETFYLNPPGFPLGITLPDPELFAKTIKTDSIRLHPDDVLVTYTDGVTEAMNPNRELYSEGRFLAAIRKDGHLNVVDFVKNLQSDLLQFTAGFEQNDDITLVSIKESMEAEDLKLKWISDLFSKVENKKVTVTQGSKDIGISTTSYYRYKNLYEEGGKSTLIRLLANIHRKSLGEHETIRLNKEGNAKLKRILILFDIMKTKEFTVKEACRKYDIPVPSFYRYKNTFEEGGFRHLRELLHGYTRFGQHHLSIEVKTKIYSIIHDNPKSGPKKIAKLLSTEKYGELSISYRHIYDELKRAKMGTKEQREGFVKRGGKQRLKPPGTPLLTLDGEVIIGIQNEEEEEKGLFSTAPVISAGVAKEMIISASGNTDEDEAIAQFSEADRTPAE